MVATAAMALLHPLQVHRLLAQAVAAVPFILEALELVELVAAEMVEIIPSVVLERLTQAAVAVAAVLTELAVEVLTAVLVDQALSFSNIQMLLL
jgi:hypothetical protein